MRPLPLRCVRPTNIKHEAAEGGKMTEAPVAVIIAAYNAASTIGASVSSALADPLVGEVVVVDDASTDGTRAAAMAVDDGTGRLRIIVQLANAGPSAARNVAIAGSSSPLLAILDADDLLVPGRFAPLLALPDWDFVADNIVFVRELPDLDQLVRSLPTRQATQVLRLGDFVLSNISRHGKQRAEMGFIKPVFRRKAFEKLALRYDEALRLGEDFIIYAQALARGARFLLTDRCGYIAIERQDSLSGQHSTDDLAALLDAGRGLAGESIASDTARTALASYLRALTVKVRHRQVLEAKSHKGSGAALLELLRKPTLAPGVIHAVINDKFRPVSNEARSPTRMLFNWPNSSG